MQLVLPPGPRQYWNELAKEHKDSPPHLKWKYAEDPFAAQEEQEKAKATKRAIAAAREANTSGKPSLKQASDEFAQVPEVKMAVSLREKVEEAIKQVGNVSRSLISSDPLEQGDIYVSRSSRYFYICS